MSDKKPNILITNDDGIYASGIAVLAETAKKYGNVTVLAPAEQCSGMSVKITISDRMVFREHSDFPVAGVKAYSLAGTPADCVKLALKNIMPEKPDFIFSGINYGFNAGFDCMYSGTVGAIMEALTYGVKAIAFSNGCPENSPWGNSADYSSFYISADEIIRDLMSRDIEKNAFWNVNFPGCAPEAFRGILDNRTLSQVRPYNDIMKKEVLSNGTVTYSLTGDLIHKDAAPEGSDIHAVLNGYVSVGKVFNGFIL